MTIVRGHIDKERNKRKTLKDKKEEKRNKD